jgi:hypothetical protein
MLRFAQNNYSVTEHCTNKKHTLRSSEKGEAERKRVGAESETGFGNRKSRGLERWLSFRE